MLALPILALVWPATALRLILMDQAVSLAAALVVAVGLRRLDVVLWFPTYFALRMLGCVVILQTFWAEIVRKRTLRTWYSVGRYAINEKSNHATLHTSLS
jgi:hypothetical protein